MRVKRKGLPLGCWALLAVASVWMLTSAPAFAYEDAAAGECVDGLDNDSDGLIDRLAGMEDPDCAGELVCTDDFDGDADGLDDRGVCTGDNTTPCLVDADCSVAGGTCDLSNQDPDCTCLTDDTGVDGCTAGDLSVSFVAAPGSTVLDPCTSTDDTITFDGVDAQYSTTGGNTRYDLQSWIALDGGNAQSGHCSQLVITPATGACVGGPTPGAVCLLDSDCGGGTCDLTNGGGGVAVPSNAQLSSGTGPMRNEDGDRCADAVGSDNVIPPDIDVVYTIPYPLTVACSDTDLDGYVEVSHCTGYDNNANGVCNSVSDNTAPGTSPKCICDVAQTFRPVADLGLSCSCSPSPAEPGWTSLCSLTYTNADLAGCVDNSAMVCELDPTVGCTSDPDCSALGLGTCGTFEERRCNSSAFVRFEVDYDEGSGAIGTTTTSGPGTGMAGGSVTDTSSELLWDVINKRDADNVISDGEMGTMTFEYTIGGGVSPGTISNPVTLQFSLNGSPPFTDDTSLTAMCDIVVQPTYAGVADFRAYEANGRVVVEWKTAVEHATAGFDLYRRSEPRGEFRKVNDRMLPGTYHLPGGVYRWVDPSARVGRVHEYLLVEIEEGGRENRYGPFRVEVAPMRRAALPRDEVDAGFLAAPRQPTPAEIARLAASRAEQDQRRRHPGGGFGASLGRYVLEVRDTGLYRLDGWASGPQGSTDFRMNLGGQQVSWLRTPEGPVFFGEGNDSSYSAVNAYKLEFGAGRQILDAGVGSGPTPIGGLAFSDTVHFEESVHLRTLLAEGPEDDYWYWLVTAAGHPLYGDQTVQLDVDDPVGAGGANLRLWVDSVSDTVELEVWLNDVQIGQPLWNGVGPRWLDVPFDPALLVDGSNDLRIVALQNVALVDSFDVTYQRAYTAVDDALMLRGDGNPVVTVDGFTSSQIYVFDVTYPRTPVRENRVTVDSAGGSFRVSFVPASPTRRYALASDAGLAPVGSWRLDAPSNLLDTSHATDYLVIAPETLRGEAESLAALRSASGLDTMVVALDDIMDEFRGGQSHPEAIRSFLRYAHENWVVPPRMVALAGDGHVDFRDDLGLGGNLVPPLMVSTGSDLVPSDSALGDVDGDGRPEIVVGRIPVVLAQELLDFVDKMAAYEASLSGTWRSNVLMVADDADVAGNFPSDSDAMIGLFPGGISASPIYLATPLTLAESRQAFVDGVNAGAGYVNFLGHGSITQFAGEGMVRVDEVQQLVNGTRLPVATALTCFIGYFGFPGFQSLGEEMLLLAAGGASAVWGPTGLSFNPDAVAVGNENFDAFFGSGGMLGDALQISYQGFVDNGGDPERLKVYSLLGDPATTLP